MPFFISLSSSLTEFSKTGLLHRAIESILLKRGFELRTAHHADHARAHLALTAPTALIANSGKDIQLATAVLLVTSVVTEAPPRLLASMLEVLADNALARKPVVLIVTGGFQGQVLSVERLLKPILLRLGTPTIAARVHLGAENWRVDADGELQQLDEVNRELTAAVDLVLRGVFLRKRPGDRTLGRPRALGSSRTATEAKKTKRDPLSTFTNVR